MMSQDQSERRNVVFRFYPNEHPELNKWLDNQSNRTQSIIFVLERMIAEFGVETDVVKNALKMMVAEETAKNNQAKDVEK